MLASVYGPPINSHPADVPGLLHYILVEKYSYVTCWTSSIGLVMFSQTSSSSRRTAASTGDVSMGWGRGLILAEECRHSLVHVDLKHIDRIAHVV